MLLLLFAGVSGVYKGLTPTIMKQGSNQAIRFFVVESLKEWYKVSTTLCSIIIMISAPIYTLDH